MQLGMVGLGRMGGDMVRRLIKDGHQCVVFNRSLQKVKQLVKGAIQLHIAGLREDGLPVPQPAARSHKVSIPRGRTRRAAGRPTRSSKALAASRLDKMHDAGKDLSEHLHLKRARRPGRALPSR